MFIKYLFILTSVLLALMISIYKIFLQNKKRTENIVRYTYFLIWVFAFYIASAFVLVFFTDGWINKTAALFLAASPFIIGKFAYYEKETVFSILQILFASFGAVYMFLA